MKSKASKHMPTVSDVKFELKTKILKNKLVKTWKNPRLDVGKNRGNL